jgi:dienelactone hydrolase
MSFGERLSRPLTKDDARPNSCHRDAFRCLHEGGTLLGRRVREVQAILDHVVGVSPNHPIGVMGISAGGLLAFLLGCVDPRVSALVVSGAFSSYETGLLAAVDGHCPCMCIPGLGRDPSLDMPALVDALIAPRPLLIQAATHDHLYPIDAVKKSVALVKHPCLATHYFHGVHEMDGDEGVEFLKTHLHRASE